MDSIIYLYIFFFSRNSGDNKKLRPNCDARVNNLCVGLNSNHNAYQRHTKQGCKGKRAL